MTKGKFRKETSAAQQKRKTILQTYLTSLVSLVLCVTMFFGTTAAWFTDTVETNQNQMYVGTLAVKLHHASYQNGNLENYTDVESQDYKVLDSSIKWEPGYTAVEKFKLTEEGSLAFGYKLNISVGETTGLTAEQFEVLTKAITVWNYIGSDAANYDLPGDFATMTASGWEKVGTLYEVLKNHMTVFSGTMSDADTKDATKNASIEHIVALHMDESFDGVVSQDETVQGKTLENITISLVATQLPSENDAFGSDYDKQVDLQVTQAVETNDAGKTTQAVSMTATNSNSPIASASVEVPAGAQLEAGATALTLTVSAAADKHDNTTVETGKSVMPLEIGVKGLASTNTKIVKVELNIGAELPYVEVFHKGQKMSGASSEEESFEYNETTGVLTLHVKSFSPFDVVYGYKSVNATTEENFRAAIENAKADEIIVLQNNLQIDADETITITSGKNVTIDLNGKTLSGISDQTGSNRNMFDANGGTLTVKNGTVTVKHEGTNMEWNNSTNVFDVTAGGVLNIENATIENLGGSDMGFCVHLNNWGEVTLNAKNTTFKSNYVAVRVFNSGNDMNNVTLEKCRLEGSSAALWVHNYTAADFSDDQNKAETQMGLLNFTLSGNTYIGNSEKDGPIRLGMTDATYGNEEILP